MIQAADGLGVSSLAFQPGGLMVVAEVSGVKIWQFETHTLLRKLPVPAQQTIAWSAADRFVVDNKLVDQQGTLVGELPPTEYDLTGRRLRTLPAGWRVVTTSTGGSLLRTERTGNQLVLQRSGGPERRIEMPAKCEMGTGPSQVAPTISANDRVVACVEHAETGDHATTKIHVWRFDGEPAQHHVHTLPGWADQLELDADGAHARIDLHDRPSVWGSVVRLDTATGATVRLGDWDRSWFDAHHTTIATSPDGRWAATVQHALLPGIDMQRTDGRGTVWRWNTIWNGAGSFNANQIDHVYFTPDSARLLVVLSSGEMILLDVHGGGAIARFGAPLELASPAFIPDAHHLVYVAGERVVRWDLARGTASDLGSFACLTGAMCPIELADNAVYLWSHPKAKTPLGNRVATDLFVVGKGTFETPPRLTDTAVDADRVPSWKTIGWPIPAGNEIVAQFPDASTVAEASLIHGLALVDVEDDAAPSPHCAIVDLKTSQRHDLVGFTSPCGSRTAGTVDMMRAARGTGMTDKIREYGTAGIHFMWRFESTAVIGSGWVIGGPSEPPSAVIAMWDRNGAHKFSVTIPHHDDLLLPLAGTRLSPDGKTVLVTLGGPKLWRIDVATGAVSEDPLEFAAIAGWLPDGDLIVVRFDGVVERRHQGAVIARANGEPGNGYFDAAAPDGSWFDVRRPDGSVQIWRTSPLGLAATLVLFRDNEYLAYTPDGYFAGTPDVGERVAWVFDKPFEGFGFEQYAAQFRRPDVIAARLIGTQPTGKPVAPRPPRLTVSPPRLAGGRATVHVAATSSGRVDLVRAFVDGRPVGAKSVCAPTGDLDLDVPVHAGNNRITVAAYDAAGLGSRLVTTTAVGPGGKTKPRLWIVAVGVSRYPGLAKDQQLEVADDDARAIADALRGNVSRGAFRDADVTLLVDQAADPTSVVRALRRLDSMAPDDLAVVFFAGHGVKVGASGQLHEDGEMMFLTSEATIKRPVGIRWNDVAAAITRARGRVVVLLDACHAGHFSRDLVVPSDDLASAFGDRGRGGALVFSAAKGRQVSYEPNTSRGLTRVDVPAKRFAVKGSPHGLFTAALLAALDDANADLDRNGELELSEWIATVTEQVAHASSGLQTPWVSRRELHGDLAIGPAGRRQPLLEANAAHSISCDRVMQKFFDLLLAKLKSVVPADDLVQGQALDDNMRRARSSMVAGCLEVDFPDSWRACVMAAPTHDAAMACQL